MLIRFMPCHIFAIIDAFIRHCCYIFDAFALFSLMPMPSATLAILLIDLFRRQRRFRRFLSFSLLLYIFSSLLIFALLLLMPLCRCITDNGFDATRCFRHIFFF